MRTRYLLSLISLFLISTNSFASFEAHEWGTFTSLVGSNGVTQNGMYHEDEPLPPFVHEFGETRPHLTTITPADDDSNPGHPCRECKGHFDRAVFSHNVVTQKMETPVIYFYSNDKQSQSVGVNVKFPQGVVTETYPAPVQTSPSTTNGLVLANGDTTFNVTITPERSAALPSVAFDNIYSHARNVASNVIQSGDENEKFIFYRGLGRFQPGMSITSKNGGLTIAGKTMPQAQFLVHVNASGETRMIDVSPTGGQTRVEISASRIAGLSNHDVPADKQTLTGAGVHNALVNALSRAGLRADEAEAMVATWEQGYFHVPGLRLLYLLPRSEIDQALPLHLQPTPARLVRVFVGRIEVMTDMDEAGILNRVLTQRDDFDVMGLGRFAEAMLRRVEEVYLSGNPSQAGAELFHRLIARAATGSSATAAVQ